MNHIWQMQSNDGTNWKPGISSSDAQGMLADAIKQGAILIVLIRGNAVPDEDKLPTLKDVRGIYRGESAHEQINQSRKEWDNESSS